MRNENFDCFKREQDICHRKPQYPAEIDPMQKWLPLNYSFVRIQNSLTNLVWDNKFFTIRG